MLAGASQFPMVNLVSHRVTPTGPRQMPGASRPVLRLRLLDEAALLVEFHAKAQSHRREDFLYFVQRLAAEILGLEHLRLGLLDQFPDSADVGILQAVIGADGKL